MSTYESAANLKDTATAGAYGALSSLVCMFPEALDPTIDRAAPSATRLRWWHIADRYGWVSRKGQWITVEGDPQITKYQKLPKQFKLSAIIHIDREAMDQARNLHSTFNNFKPAVAYRLGSAIMGGRSTRHAVLGLEHPNDPDYKVAMGIGDGPLIVNAGITGLVNNIPISRATRSRSYIPLESGIRLGEILPKEEVPPTIPSV